MISHLVQKYDFLKLVIRVYGLLRLRLKCVIRE